MCLLVVGMLTFSLASSVLESTENKHRFTLLSWCEGSITDRPGHCCDLPRSGVDPVSCAMGTGINKPECETRQSFQCSSEVNNFWNFTSALPCISVVTYLFLRHILKLNSYYLEHQNIICSRYEVWGSHDGDVGAVGLGFDVIRTYG
jgi:hypothetical protein